MEREPLFPIPEDYRFYPRPVSVMFGRGAYAPSVWTSDVGYGVFGGAAVGIVAAAATFFGDGVGLLTPACPSVVGPCRIRTLNGR